jgi:hypothetical protein
MNFGALAWLVFAFVIYLVVNGRLSAWLDLVTSPGKSAPAVSPP